jgi:hypothetical protein
MERKGQIALLSRKKTKINHDHIDLSDVDQTASALVERWFFSGMAVV